VQFAFDQSGKQPAAFVLQDRRLITDPPDNAELITPSTSAPGMTVGHWQSEANPTLNSVVLKLDRYERAIAVAVNDERLLLGADWSLRLFDKPGSEVWSVAVPGTVWAVNVTPDGRLAVAALNDGTIRWYRMRDGQELLALFPDADGKRWVAWTPQGYYDASVGGDELIGWHINRGADKGADFFPAAQFRDRFNRPTSSRWCSTRSMSTKPSAKPTLPPGERRRPRLPTVCRRSSRFSRRPTWRRSQSRRSRSPISYVPQRR